MKNFWKQVLATVVGLMIVSLLCTVMSVVWVIGAMTSSSEQVYVDDNSVMVIKLAGSISERAESDPMTMLLGGGTESLGLDDIVKGIDNARDNDDVKGIYLECGMLAGASPATLEEIRSHLVDFKKSGKFILAYGDNFTQGEYYLSSVADSIVINPQGILDLHGMALSSMSYKELMDKVGVKMQIFKVGTYKSAVEPYVLPHMSDANREQLQTLGGEIWGRICEDISKSRKKLTVEKLNQMADEGMTFADTKEYKKNGLVDKLAFADEVPEMIAAMMGVDDKDDYSTISVGDMASIHEAKDDSGNEVAVYYAVGDIVDTEVTSLMSDGQQIVGKTVAEDLRELAEDDDVKAVVLRVNSPGGSAYASERIWHEVMNLKAKKPVVVSMGGYAASGGYYISCAATKIYAEPTTLTGSIGIFGMFPDASELMNDKLGVHVDVVKTNEYSDFGSYYRPMNEGEQQLLQAYINRGYELFTKRCADGRGLSQDSIKVIGEGRVWSGLHAKQIGLVDKLGTLDDAISEAKKLAKVESCTVVSYPSEPDFMEQVMKSLEGSSDSYADAKLKAALGDYWNTFRFITEAANRPTIQARMPFDICIR